MCYASPIQPVFQRPALTQNNSIGIRSVEPCLQRWAPARSAKIDSAVEATKAFYPPRTGPSVEDKILDILKNGYEPPVTLGSKLKFSDMDPLNSPVCLGFSVTFKSLGFGNNT